jgi:response regulator of citrate/malate metabolism
MIGQLKKQIEKELDELDKIKYAEEMKLKVKKILELLQKYGELVKDFKKYDELHQKMTNIIITNHYIKKSNNTKRSEIAIKNSKKIAENTKKKVLNLVTGIMANEYKKKTGAWNISKIAKESGVTRDSVRKYLKEANLYENY